MPNSSALGFSILAGTILQLAMVIAGHFLPVIAQGFAIGGTAISAIAGLVYARRAAGTWLQQVLGGAIAGGACALIGIAVSCWLGDVAPLILVIGTTSSTVTGAIGGALGKITAPRDRSLA